MNIVVCIKQTPDTSTIIKIKDCGTKIDSDGIKYEVNPYDLYAVEEALQIKERLSGTVTVISLGSSTIKASLQKCLAMGADNAILIDDTTLTNPDNYEVARILSDNIKDKNFDLILCGKQSVDDDSHQVGQMVAEFLDLPHVGVVTKVTVSDDQKSLTVQREIEGALIEIKTDIPALLTCQKGLNEPRLPSLKGIMGAKKKPIDVVSPAPLNKSKLKIVSLSLPKARADGKIIDEGDLEASVRKLVMLLKDEAKVIL